jgi:hypothetical protein
MELINQFSILSSYLIPNGRVSIQSQKSIEKEQPEEKTGNKLPFYQSLTNHNPSN